MQEVDFARSFANFFHIGFKRGVRMFSQIAECHYSGITNVKSAFMCTRTQNLVKCAAS